MTYFQQQKIEREEEIGERGGEEGGGKLVSRLRPSSHRSKRYRNKKTGFLGIVLKKEKL